MAIESTGGNANSSVTENSRRQSAHDAAHLPKRPKKFCVVVCEREQADSSVSVAPNEITHLATIAFSSPDAPLRVVEYWLRAEPDKWVVYRVASADAKGGPRPIRKWETFAIARRGPEDVRSAGVYILHDAWKVEAAKCSPKVVQEGICTWADLRWIFSQAGPPSNRINSQSHSRKRTRTRSRKRQDGD